MASKDKPDKGVETKSIDSASQKMILKACEDNVDISWDRFEKQQPDFRNKIT